MDSALDGSETGLVGAWSLDEQTDDIANYVNATPPVITLNGDADTTLVFGLDTYQEFGATVATAVMTVGNATQNGPGSYHSKPATVSIAGSVGTDLGDYTLTYTATDALGNTGTATRTVHVVDTTPPVITLNGPAEITIDNPLAYTETATAVDDADGNVNVVLSGSVGPDPGQYTLTYTAADAAGNAATVETRTVTVEPHDFQSYDDGIAARDLSFGAEGTFRRIDMRGFVQTSTPQGWVEVDGLTGAQRLAVDTNGNAWVVKDDGNVFAQVDGSNWEWNHMNDSATSFTAIDIGVGADGTVKVVDSDGRIYLRGLGLGGGSQRLCRLAHRGRARWAGLGSG